MSEADREKKIIERLEDTFYVNNGKGIKHFQKVTLYEEGIQDILQLLHMVEQKDKKIKELEEENAKYKSLDYMFKIQNEENYVDMKKIYFEWLDSIPKQVVIEALNTHKFAYEELNKKYDNTYYEDDEIRTRDFYMIVTQDRIVQVLKKLSESET